MCCLLVIEEVIGAALGVVLPEEDDGMGDDGEGDGEGDATEEGDTEEGDAKLSAQLSAYVAISHVSISLPLSPASPASPPSPPSPPSPSSTSIVGSGSTPSNGDGDTPSTDGNDGTTEEQLVLDALSSSHQAQTLFEIMRTPAAGVSVPTTLNTGAAGERAGWPGISGGHGARTRSLFADFFLADADAAVPPLYTDVSEAATLPVHSSLPPSPLLSSSSPSLHPPSPHPPQSAIPSLPSSSPSPLPLLPRSASRSHDLCTVPSPYLSTSSSFSPPPSPAGSRERGESRAPVRRGGGGEEEMEAERNAFRDRCLGLEAEVAKVREGVARRSDGPNGRGEGRRKVDGCCFGGLIICIFLSLSLSLSLSVLLFSFSHPFSCSCATSYPRLATPQTASAAAAAAKMAFRRRPFRITTPSEARPRAAAASRPWANIYTIIILPGATTSTLRVRATTREGERCGMPKGLKEPEEEAAPPRLQPRRQRSPTTTAA